MRWQSWTFGPVGRWGPAGRLLASLSTTSTKEIQHRQSGGSRPGHCRLSPEGILSRVQDVATFAIPTLDSPRHWRATVSDSLKNEESAQQLVTNSTGRRSFLQGAAAAAALSAMPRWAEAHPDDFNAIRAEIEKHHDEAVKRLQTWIRQPSIAAENRGMNEGCELMMEMLREAGFGGVKKMPTDGQPGVFAMLDAGASKTLGLYFMYDVKQADPAEWSSPPFEAALIDKPGLGKIIMGRGAVNQKGPEA